MAYQLPPDIDQRIKARMSNGAYQSEDDVLREAMDALEEREREKLLRWQERNQLATEQSRQGLSKPLDLEAALGRVEQRIAQQGQGQ